MSTLDDKLLGEKLHYYCSSSSEDEAEDEDPGEDHKSETNSSQPPAPTKWNGGSCNTGPKGVIKDYQRFKQLERERAEEQKDELSALAKKFSITCRSTADDEKADRELEEELAGLMDESCIQQFVQQRMQEMLFKESMKLRFGSIHVLKDGQEFLSAVETEDSSVCVVVLLHEPGAAGCPSALKAIQALCGQHVHVKFCSVRPSQLAMSSKFKEGGVPAVLAYRGGQLFGNCVRFTVELGEEFEADEFEGYLVEHGILNDRGLVPVTATYSSDED